MTAAGTLAAAPFVLPLSAESPAWLATTYREPHLDAHFSRLAAPYAQFDAESTAQTVQDSGFQMVSFFAVRNSGYSYYPTKLGVIHPGLKRDFTGQLAAALKKRGIRVLAYVSAGPDCRVHQQHPEWTIVRNPTAPPRGDVASMCLNSPWVEQAHIPQLQELICVPPSHRNSPW